MSSNVRVGNNVLPCLRLGMHALKKPEDLGGESSTSGLAALTLTEVFDLRKAPPAAETVAAAAAAAEEEEKVDADDEGPAPWSGLLTDRVRTGVVVLVVLVVVAMGVVATSTTCC